MKIFPLFLSGIALFYLFPFFPATASLLLAGSTGFFMVRRRYLPWLLLIAGFAYAFLRYAPLPDQSALSGREIMLECVAESPPRELPSGRFVNEVKVISALDQRDGAPLGLPGGSAMNIFSEQGMPWHMRYSVTVKMEKDRRRFNPGATSPDALYASLVTIGKAEPAEANRLQRWFQDRRDRLNLFFRDRFQGDTGALLASQTTGERSSMSDEAKDAFNATGLAHLLSISGTHFGLFSALVFGFFRVLIRSMPYRFLQWFTIYLTPSQAAALFALPLMLFYLLLSGTSIPAVRSFIMINLFLFGLLLGRKGFWLNSLLFAAFAICVWDPSALLSISFQLSFLAVFCIGLFLAEERETPEDLGSRSRVAAFLKGSVLLSLAASLGTAPLVVYYFHYFSVISPAANFLITPFICFLLVPLSLFCSFIFLVSGHYPFSGLVASLADISLSGVKLFASVPFADLKVPALPLIVIIVFYAGLIAYFVSGRRTYPLVLPLASIVLCLFLFSQGRNALAVTYLDVGQGDAAVIEGYGKTIIIDAGRTGRELEGYLRYLGKRTIDALVITHADDDHAAGVPYLIKRLTVKEVWDNGMITYPDSLLKNTIHRSLMRGDEVSTGNLAVLVLHPYPGFYTFADNEASEENNDSLVVKVTGRKSFLFTGDSAGEAEEDMLLLGARLRSDVLKVSHHGSRTSSTEDFLTAVSPGIAVISVGRGNTYGHPHREALERFRGARICRTDRDGAVKVTETPEGLAVKTFREFRFERVKDLSGEGRNIVRLFARW
jgi:competence protein ComEC